MTTDEAEGEGFEPTVGTGPTPVFKTEGDERNALVSQGNSPVGTAGSRTGSRNLAAPTLHVDLARVVELWPVLPPAIRAAVLVLANTSDPATPQQEQEQDGRLPPGYEKQIGQ